MATVNRDKRDIAWTPDTLRERQGALVGHQEKTKPPGTSGSLAFPCKRADHLEVSCSERYPQQLRPSNGSDKFTFHWMWTTCGNGVYCNRMLVDHAGDRIVSRRSPCGNLSSRWSDLICLAIYVPLSSADLGFVSLCLQTGCCNEAASVGKRAPQHGGGASRGVLPLRTTTTTAADSKRDGRAAQKMCT
jgi:hypothetical protein